MHKPHNSNIMCTQTASVFHCVLQRLADQPGKLHRQAAILLATAIFHTCGMAQTAAGDDLIDVASFINGAYPYIPSAEERKDIHDMEHFHHQLHGISQQGDSNDLFYISDGSRQKILYYALAAPATIDSFHIRSTRDSTQDSMPGHFEFSISGLPDKDFQTVAVLDVPVFHGRTRQRYDFSIPVDQKIPGRYLRVIVSDFKHDAFWNFNFSAQGRFSQPVQSQADFGGIYALGHWQSIVSSADLDMASNQKGTGYGSYLILHQKGKQTDGCYVHGLVKIEEDGSRNFEVISEVIGTLQGRVENNVFRFTRTSAGSLESRHGAMAFAPAGNGIKTAPNYGYLMVMKNPQSRDSDYINKIMEEGFQAFNVSVSSRVAADTAATCAITGKVRFDNMYFNFDSKALTPESKAALDKVAEAAKAYPQWKFEISGHTDAIGPAEYNLKLSERRAAAVVRYLVSQGVDAAQLQAKGYGATRLLSGNVHRSMNRRVEIIQQ